ELVDDRLRPRAHGVTVGDVDDVGAHLAVTLRLEQRDGLSETFGVPVGDREPGTALGSEQGHLAAHAATGPGDHGDLVAQRLHAETFFLLEGVRWPVDSTGRGVTSYASLSKRESRRRKVKVARGHRVVLRPWSSRYQLAQPPVFQTVDCMRRCRS